MKKLSLLIVITVLVNTYVTAAADTKVGEKQAPATIPATCAIPAPMPATVAESLKIYYVDPYKIIPNLEQWKDERIKIQKELEMRTNQIEELKMAYSKKATELQSMGNIVKDQAKEAAREDLLRLENSIQIKQQSFQEFAERTTQEAQMNIFKEIETAAKEYAHENKADFVFAGGALYVNPKFDISDLITDRMNARYLAQKRKDQAATPSAPNQPNLSQQRNQAAPSAPTQPRM